MGDVNVTDLPEIRFDPNHNEIGIDEVKNIEPLRIAKIAPAAVHVKELNHIDPLTVESLQVDAVRNIDPLEVERFDVTSLPTVNLTIGQAPELDLNLREIPPFALGVHQDFELPSEYCIRARLLGFEFLRVHVTGRTVMHPRDRVPREVSSSHERSYREVAAVGNPAIPVTCREERAEAVVHARPAPHAGPRHGPPRPAGPRHAAPRPAGPRHAAPRLEKRPSHAGHGMRVGAPPHAFALESAVSSG